MAGVLALGWLADTLGQLAPRTTFSNGETQQAGVYRVALSVAPTPAHAGDAVVVSARVEESDGRPASGLSVRLLMTMPAMDMTPVETPLALNADGAYAARTTFPMSGAWLVRVELAPPGAAPTHTDFDVPVR
jgi:nitrogen fixation protein FixH